MANSTIILTESKVSPPPSTLNNRSLRLNFIDIVSLLSPPVHLLFFYELPMITRSQFLETIVPTLNHSLSTTLQYFWPYAGNLIIFPTSQKIPEIRYVEGDYVNVTYSESCNLDFNHLTGNHPRNCDKFYPLIPLLGPCVKISDYLKTSVFSVQVTLFPNNGISVGVTAHHTVADARTDYDFLNVWAMISKWGSDDLYRSRGAFPLYDRVINYPTRDEIALKNLNLETLNRGYQHRTLSGPTDKVRSTFIMTKSVINGLKKLVSTRVPNLEYLSSFTVSCAYIWTCLAKSCKNNKLEALIFSIDCRTRMNPPIPTTYFGNCIVPCLAVATTSVLTQEEGFVLTTKLVGENLHKLLTDEDGIMNAPFKTPFPSGKKIAVAASAKLSFYELDFGWGNPKKQELNSTEYEGSISLNAGKESKEDMEIEICLSATEMQDFIRIFNDGLQTVVDQHYKYLQSSKL